jgi:hypothetical protein
VETTFRALSSAAVLSPAPLCASERPSQACARSSSCDTSSRIALLYAVIDSSHFSRAACANPTPIHALAALAAVFAFTNRARLSV